MQKKILLGILLLLVFSVNVLIKPSSAADTLQPSDFKLESFSKTVDFFDYARAYAAAYGKVPPLANEHAYLYQVYINVSGFQLFYSGLINITGNLGGAITIPVQSFLEHYKTPGGKDVLMSSSFIMLMAFNDTATSLYPNSPDRNDNLYASFSLGFDLSAFGAKRPALNSKTTLIPLTRTGDTWSWGMKYTNLTAIWWRMDINPLTPGYNPFPIAITTYDELTFTYNLALDPTGRTAKVTANYVIGRMTNLWLFYWFGFLPIITHYNSTGYYGLGGNRISSETIYQYLERQRIKMSIILFQNSLVLDKIAKSTFNNQNVTDAEVDVSNSAIQTEAENQTGGEKETIFKADFGTKKQYKLYNYTADPSETTFSTYDSTTRTAPRSGYAKNPLFSIHVGLLKYVPLIVKQIDPPLFEKAKDRMLNMTYADYFYITAYPKYSGFRVEHDPTYTAYVLFTPTAGLPNLIWLLLIGGVIAVVFIGAVFALRKRGIRSQPIQEPPAPPAPPAPPTVIT